MRSFTPALLALLGAQIGTVERHGLPGMGLNLAPKHLVKRCSCGRVISENKLSCLACKEAAMQARELPTEDATGSQAHSEIAD